MKGLAEIASFRLAGQNEGQRVAAMETNSSVGTIER
jgi:hypothetical protein